MDPWASKNPWKRRWRRTPVFLPGKSHGQRSLAGYGPWCRKRVGYNSATKQQRSLKGLVFGGWWCGDQEFPVGVGKAIQRKQAIIYLFFIVRPSYQEVGLFFFLCYNCRHIAKWFFAFLLFFMLPITWTNQEGIHQLDIWENTAGICCLPKRLKQTVPDWSLSVGTFLFRTSLLEVPTVY